MEQLIPDNLTFTDVSHLPILKEFAKRIKLVYTINTMVASQMQLLPGQAVLAMVLDTISGRTPLYRLKEFFHAIPTTSWPWFNWGSRSYCFVYFEMACNIIIYKEKFKIINLV